MVPLPPDRVIEGRTEDERSATGAVYLVEHAVQLIPRFSYAVAVVAVHHEDQALRVLEVVPPERTDLQTPGQRGQASFLPVIPPCSRNYTKRAPTLSWPPTSHTVKLMFLYSTVSTLKPAAPRKPVHACSQTQARCARF